MDACSSCDGSGTVKCPTCEGEGQRYFVPVLDIWESDCSKCYGLGTITCPDCAAQGPHPVHLTHAAHGRASLPAEARS